MVQNNSLRIRYLMYPDALVESFLQRYLTRIRIKTLNLSKRHSLEKNKNISGGIKFMDMP